MTKINIKQLANNIKDKKGAEVAPTVNETVVETRDNSDVESIETSVEQKESVKEVDPVSVENFVSEGDSLAEKSKAVNEVKEKQANSRTSPMFNLDHVISWKRPETTGKKKLVELHKEYDTFFAKVKATTGVSTVKFVNFLIRDFLVKNPDFVQFINEESGKSPQLE